MSIEEWTAHGLYDPNAEGAEDRLALLTYLSERGATIEQMVEAHQFGSLPAVAGDLIRRSTVPTSSVEEVAARSGVSVARVQRILLSLGFPMAPDSPLPDNTEVLISVFEQGAALLGEDGIFAFTRVMGAATRTIAEAAVALFYSELGPGSGREAASEIERAEVAEKSTVAFSLVPGLVAGVLNAQFDRATRQAMQQRPWSTSADDAEHPEAGGVAVAIGFVDLVGSTAWAENLALRDHSLALSRFETAAWASAVLAGGRVIKMIGDEVFFTAPDVDAAAAIGLEICEFAAADPLLPLARGAVGFGAVTHREGDLFGPLVNQVARLADLASPEDLLVTVDAAAKLDRAQFAAHPHDPLVVEGLDEPVEVFVVEHVVPPARPTGGTGGPR